MAIGARSGWRSVPALVSCRERPAVWSGLRFAVLSTHGLGSQLGESQARTAIRRAVEGMCPILSCPPLVRPARRDFAAQQLLALERPAGTRHCDNERPSSRQLHGSSCRSVPGIACPAQEKALLQ